MAENVSRMGRQHNPKNSKEKQKSSENDAAMQLLSHVMCSEASTSMDESAEIALKSHDADMMQT